MRLRVTPVPIPNTMVKTQAVKLNYLRDRVGKKAKVKELVK